MEERVMRSRLPSWASVFCNDMLVAKSDYGGYLHELINYRTGTGSPRILSRRSMGRRSHSAT